MKNQNFTAAFSVYQSPEEVFDAINNVGEWWSEEIDGRTDKLGAEFEFRHKDDHRSTQKITEFVPCHARQGSCATPPRRLHGG